MQEVLYDGRKTAELEQCEKCKISRNAAAGARNERQVALCLLEVGRRSAALGLGLPAPQLVRLEAQIDAEMDRDDDDDDDSGGPSTNGGDDDIDDDDNDDEESPSNWSASPAAACTTSRPSTAREVNSDHDHDQHEEVHQEESASNSSTSAAAARVTSRRSRIKPPSVVVSRHNDVDGPAASAESTDCEEIKRTGAVWQRRRYRPLIPVDMMSLDEMVSPSLNLASLVNLSVTFQLT